MSEAATSVDGVHDDMRAPDHGGSGGTIPLDPSQRAVLDAPADESLAVVGAPGSGKSTTLVELVAHRIAEGMSPDAVLALVPGRRAATVMRDRLASRVGVATAGALARTPQSFAFEVVRADRARSGDEPPTLVTGADQDAVLRDIIAGDTERGAGDWDDTITADVRALRGFRSELRDLMATMSEFDVTPEELAALSSHRPAWRGAARVVAEVVEALSWQRESALDAPGLLLEAASVLYDSPRGSGPFGSLRLVVVDDAQELTEAARRLLVALEASGVTVVTFGDPDIATSVFRGGVAELASDWRGGTAPPPARALLTCVHRSGTAIREAVTAIVGRVGVRGEGRHRAAAADASGPHGSVERLRVSSRVEEATAIARYLRERHLVDGIAWRDMVVIARTGAAVPRLERLLARDDVPTSSPRPAPAGEDPGVQALVQIAALADERVALDAAVIESVLRSPLFGVDALRLRQLRRALRFEELDAGGSRTGDELLVEAVAAVGGLVTVDPDAPSAARSMARLAADRRLGAHPAVRAATRLGRALREATRRIHAGAAADEVLYEVWAAADVAELWRERALGDGEHARWAGAQLDAVVTLFDVAKRFVERAPDAPVGVFLDEWTARDVVADTLASRGQEDAVTIATPSATVGSQFRVAVIAGVEDGVWPNLRIRDSLLGAGHLADLVTGRDAERSIVDRRREVLDDETRMFAQALSRASERVLVTAVEGDEAQPSTLFRGLHATELESSALGRPFTLRGLTAELRRTGVREPERRDEAAALLAELAENGVDGAAPTEWFGLRERTSPGLVLPDADGAEPVIGVAPSGIESFERCGVEWFVQHHGGRTTSTQMALGTIAHAAGEFEFQTRDDRLAYARERLDELPTEAPWHRVQLERQVERFVGALCDYLDARRADSAELVGVERRFEVDLPVVAGDLACTVRLTGSIDRLEHTADDGTVIIDFKTGRTMRSKDEIATDAQLASYQFAYRNDAIGPAREHDAASCPAPPADPGGAVTGGPPIERASLVYLAVSAAAGSWSTRDQEPMGAEDERAFRERVAATALGMIGASDVTPARRVPGDPSDEVRDGDAGPTPLDRATYLADPEEHCLTGFGGRPACRIHIVPEVTE